MSIFESPLNNLAFTILASEIWEDRIERSPTYYKKHSAADAYRYRFTPAISEEVWAPDFLPEEI